MAHETIAVERVQLALNQASQSLRIAQLHILATKDPEVRKRAADAYNTLVRQAVESQFRYTE